jgi:hypothetical protein
MGGLCSLNEILWYRDEKTPIVVVLQRGDWNLIGSGKIRSSWSRDDPTIQSLSIVTKEMRSERFDS